MCEELGRKVTRSEQGAAREERGELRGAIGSLVQMLYDCRYAFFRCVVQNRAGRD